MDILSYNTIPADIYTFQQINVLKYLVFFRCKLYYMKDKAFVEKGLGMLHLKKVEGDDTKTQMVVRAETNLGKIYFLVSRTMYSLKPCLP